MIAIKKSKTFYHIIVIVWCMKTKSSFLILIIIGGRCLLRFLSEINVKLPNLISVSTLSSFLKWTLLDSSLFNLWIGSFEFSRFLWLIIFFEGIRELDRWVFMIQWFHLWDKISWVIDTIIPCTTSKIKVNNLIISFVVICLVTLFPVMKQISCSMYPTWMIRL